MGFIEFVRKHGVVGLAVGVVMGGAVTKLVNALVADLVAPVIGFVTNGIALNNLVANVPVMGNILTFKYGDFLTELINFVAICLVIYYVFVRSPLGKLDKKD